MRPRRSERGVTGQQGRAKRFGEGDIGGIVRRDTAAKSPDPGQEQVMRVAGEREIHQILQSLGASLRDKVAGDSVAAEDLCDLQIQEVRGMQGFARGKQPIGDPA